MALHVVQGTADRHDAVLEQLARHSGETSWTVPKSARPGDDLVFYIKGPTSAFVATGRVLSDTWPGTSDEGQGRYLARVGDVTLLPVPKSRDIAATAIPDWRWLRFSRSLTTLPDERAAQLRRVLGVLPGAGDDLGGND